MTRYTSSFILWSWKHLPKENFLRCFVISGLPVKWTVKSIKTACFSGECTRRYESYRKELARVREGEKYRHGKGQKTSSGSQEARTRKGPGEESGFSLIKRSRWFLTESSITFAYPRRYFTRYFVFDARATSRSAVRDSASEPNSTVRKTDPSYPFLRERKYYYSCRNELRAARSREITYIHVWRVRLRLV